MLLVAAFLWGLAGAVGEEGGCPASKPSLKLSGMATITAILDGHSGPNCTSPVYKGRQQMAALAWLVNTFNHAQFIPGIKIGLSLYDACSTYDGAQKAILSSALFDSCTDKYSLGMLTTPTIYQAVKPLPDTLHTPISLTSDMSFNAHIYDIITHLLLANNWTTVDFVLSWSEADLDNFGFMAKRGGICILNTNLVEYELEDTVNIISGSGTVLVFGPIDMAMKILHSTIASDDSGENRIQWVLVSSDLKDTSAGDIPENTILVTFNPVVLRQPSEDDAPTDPWASVDRQVFLSVATTVFDVVVRLKLGVETHCPSNQTFQVCPDLPSFHELQKMNSTRLKELQTIPHLFQSLHVTTKNDNSIFYVIMRVKNDGNGTRHFEKTGIYQLLDVDEEPNAIFKFTSLGFKNDSLQTTNSSKICLPNRYNEYDSHCQKCVNFLHHANNISDEFLFASISFREDAWVSALISISILGVLCCLAIAIFIIVRSCKGDVLEGNPSFSFLLIFAIILTYASVVPFSIQIPNVGALCALRVFATSISYALLFSVMLSRGLMLASCDNEGGFMSHVNGYLQTVLCFFIFGLQFALGIQLWLMSVNFIPKELCTFNKGNVFLAILGYDAFLLLVLLCTTPFIAQSKRNYREGVFFTAAAIVCTLVWATWVVGYVFAPKWRDLIVASGLTATATAVLISVFIPRSYLMMSAITRDNIANALPAMAYNSTSILDLNYRSSAQALYATVNPVQETRQHSTGHANPNFYSDQPEINDLESNSRTVPSTAKLNSCSFGGRRSPTPENTYARYDTPPSPLKVTRF